MGSGDKDVALRKRQQIDSSKRTMFIFVAVAALVVSFFLVQQLWFQGLVISQKQATVNTINANLKAVDGLKDNIRLLDTNEALSSVKSSDDSSAVQAVLDALPTEPNADALGASLQVMFVGAIDGLTIESLSVTDPSDEGALTASGSDSEPESNDPNLGIGFSMSVSGSAEQLKALLARFERSIRVIKIDSLSVEASKDSLTMDIEGRAYYQPAYDVKIDKKVIKP